jgi:fatty acid kinase fatty acid binding subunit
MTVSILTDSAAALPRDLAEQHAIDVVPMWLNVDGDAYHEGDIPLVELLGRADVKTSSPTPGEFEAAAREHLAADGELICTVASSMSATYDAAVLGTRELGDRILVFDTGTAAGAEALVVLAAAEAAEHGAALDGVADAARRAASEVRLVATLPSLEHLVRSGRVPNIAGRAGRLLGIAPMFEFRNGRARPLRPAIGVPAALDRMVAAVRRDRRPDSQLHVAALHAEAEDAATDLLARVSSTVEPATAFVASFGSVMIVHTGPGLIGLAWWWETTTARAT